MVPSLFETAKSIVGIGCLASTVTLGALYLGQRALIFPRPAVTELPSTYGGPKVRTLRIGSDDGEVVCAYFPPPDDRSPVLVYWHGNADQIGWSGSWLGRRLSSSHGFLAVEFPGYGLAAGAPSQASIFASAKRAVSYAIDDLGIHQSRLRLVGQSIGCAAAVEVASARPDIPVLVLISPFTSIPDVARTLFPFLPTPLLDALVRDPFRNRDAAPRLAARALVVHGTRDEIVPFHHGRTIADLLPNATFLPVQGAGHNDLFSPPHDTLVLATILRFCQPPAP